METECKKCKKRFKGEKNIMCSGLCGKVFHEKCTGLADYDARSVHEKKNLAFICDQCVDEKNAIFNTLNEMLNSINENKEYILKQERMVRDILENCNTFGRRETPCAGVNPKAKETYASQLQKEPLVIIKPKSKQPSEKTKEDLKKNVDPSNLKISEVAKKQNGIVQISCVSEGDRSIIKHAVEEKLGEDYEVKLPVLKKPKVIICGLSDEIESGEIEKSLRAQNAMLAASEIKCMKIIKIKCTTGVARTCSYGKS